MGKKLKYADRVIKFLQTRNIVSCLIMLMNDVTNESVTKISFRKMTKNSARVKT